MNEEARAAVLARFGATPGESAELLEYNRNVFERDESLPARFPLPDEPLVEAWERYAAAPDTFEALRTALVQLRFPVRAGISREPAYRAATLRGEPHDGRLELNRPDALELTIHPTPAGRIPVLVAGDRGDFVALVRALASRNEPVDVPASMGATMVAGLNNWERIERYRRAWTGTDWQAEFQRLIPKRELYQDRFVLLSTGPYSGVAANEMGLSEAEWRAASLAIRREHECAHYFTKRVFKSMRNNLLDELIADHRGIVAAAGRYRADWFLRFLGLEDFPRYRSGGRLENYRGELSGGAFAVLAKLVVAAARNLERLEGSADEILLALTGTTLEELAAPEGQLL